MDKIIDTHAHLEQLADLEGTLKRAKQAGISGIVAVGVDFSSNKKILHIAQTTKAPKIYPALGIHPANLLAEQLSDCFALMEENMNKAAALGEMGLDFWYKQARKDGRARTEQVEVFVHQLVLARQYRKAVIIHSRGAWQQCLEKVRQEQIEKAVFHWYSGPEDILQEILKNGYFISATPAAEYSPEHRTAIAKTPLDNLLIETDSPVVFKPQSGSYQSEPKDVLRTLKAVAQIKNIKEEALAVKTYENARYLFGLG